MAKGEATRERILDQALATATQVGFEGLSLGDLARAAGMSKSGLFAHFGSKEDLQQEVLRTAADRFIAAVVAPALREPRGEPRVRALFALWLAWEEDPSLPGGCPFIAVANELDDRPGPLRDTLVALQRDWLGTLATAARIAVAEGHFRADLDVEQFACDVYSTALGYHQYRRLLRDPAAATRAQRAFARILADAR
jgi:AcrR family transcriptional regulator